MLKNNNVKANNKSVNKTETKKTRKIYQTGHAKNVSNFDSMLVFVEGYGTLYNPGKELLKLPNLLSLKDKAFQKINAVNMSQSAYTTAVTERDDAFEDIDQFITNVFLQLKAYESSRSVLKDFQTYVRKFKGRRAIAKITKSELEALSQTENEVKYNSIAQMGFDMRVENFGKIITMLETIPSYSPNEPAYTIQGLKEKLELLKTKNNKVTQTTMLLANARLERTEILYTPETGLYEVAVKVKAYVRSIFNLNSEQYKQIKNINFKLHI